MIIALSLNPEINHGPQNKNRPPSQHVVCFAKGGSYILAKRLVSHHRPELIPVHQHSTLVAVRANAAGDHLHRHTDLRRGVAQVGQLRGDHRAFVQLDPREVEVFVFARVPTRLFIPHRLKSSLQQILHTQFLSPIF